MAGYKKKANVLILGLQRGTRLRVNQCNVFVTRLLRIHLPSSRRYFAVLYHLPFNPRTAMQT